MVTIEVGMEPRWVELAPDGSRAYVTLSDASAHGPASGAIAVIDTGTNEVAAEVGLRGQPSGVTVAPDGRRVYAPSFDTTLGRGVVSVIDADHSIVDNVAVSGLGGGPNGIAITRDGREVYVATDHDDEPDGRVSVIDTTTHEVIATVGVNPFPSAVTLRPDGRFLYVLDNDGDPAMIDTGSHHRTFPFAHGLSADRIAFAPDGERAYAISDAGTAVQVVDVVRSEVVDVLDARGLTTDVAVSPNGRFLYVTQRTLHQLSAFEIGAGPVPTHPASWTGTADGIAVTADGSTAYVSDRRSRAVRVVGLPSLAAPSRA